MVKHCLGKTESVGPIPTDGSKVNKYNYKKIVKSVFWAIVLITFVYFLYSIDKEILENIAIRLGWLGPVFIGLVLVCTQVFAPLSGSAFFFIGVKLYGYQPMLVLFYCTSMISAPICFFVARTYGRGMVTKLVGKENMGRLDEVTLLHEKPLLIVGRTLGYYFFDFISYALGLTKISFKKYFSYTVLLTLIPYILLYFVFKNLNFDNFRNVMVFYGAMVITGIVFAYLFGRLVRKARLNK